MSENTTKNKKITKKEIGDLLKKEYGDDDQHIGYFFFHVEVNGEYEQEKIQKIELSKIFEKYNDCYIVEDFGSVKVDNIFTTLYFVEKKRDTEGKTQRQVEKQLEDTRELIRKQYKHLGVVDKDFKDKNIKVLITRCCKYTELGIN